MLRTTPGRRVALDLVAAAACALAVWWTFTLGHSVPLLEYVDLGFHELGHLLFAWAPGMAGPLAGSVAQVGVPLGLAIYFGAVRRESYSTALMLAWLGTSAQNVSVYVADASLQSLPLLGNGRHDWAFIFSSIGHLEWAAPASTAIQVFGLAAVMLGLLVAVVPLVLPPRRPRAVPRSAASEAERLAALPRREPRNRTVGGTSIGRVDAPAPWRMGPPR